MSWHTSISGSFWSSFNSLGIDFLHAQIFGDNLPNVILFHVQLTYDLSNSQPRITIYHQPYLLNVDLAQSAGAVEYTDCTTAVG